LSKIFPGVLGEILLVDIFLVFSITFLVDKELSCLIGCLFGITGFWSIKIGLIVFGTWEKFSVLGGSGSFCSPFSSNHFLTCGMSGVSLSPSPLVSCQYKAVVLILLCPNSFCKRGSGIPKLA